jgi:hypothetical protein
MALDLDPLLILEVVDGVTFSGVSIEAPVASLVKDLYNIRSKPKS